MNGIEKITQRITADAQAEIDRVLGAAREEAARITARMTAEADAVAAELAAKNEKSAAEHEERLVSAAQMEARKVQLAAKQEMLEKAYECALEKLCAMPAEQYTAVLAALMVKASSTGTESVIFSAEDREKVGKAAVEKSIAPSKPWCACRRQKPREQLQRSCSRNKEEVSWLKKSKTPITWRFLPASGPWKPDC